MKRCSCCGEDKPATIEHFTPRRFKCGMGWYSACRPCTKARRDAKRERGRDPLNRRVDPAPVLVAVECSRDDFNTIAWRLGWTDDGRADAARVRRVLERDSITLRNAARILDAIGVLPTEVGL